MAILNLEGEIVDYSSGFHYYFMNRKKQRQFSQNIQ